MAQFYTQDYKHHCGSNYTYFLWTCSETQYSYL